MKPGVKYPPVFFVTATSDDRVTPVHARKMAAKMEAQGHEVLFYREHRWRPCGRRRSRQAAEMWALSFVYLKRKLGWGRSFCRSAGAPARMAKSERMEKCGRGRPRSDVIVSPPEFDSLPQRA